MEKLRFLFTAKDYEATIAFYRDGMELPIEESWDRGIGDRGTLFIAASGLVEVVDRNPENEYVPPRGAGVVIEVQDVDEWYRRVVRKRLPIVQELANQSWGHRNFIVKDPDGIEVHVFSFFR